jgi:APA family basic amino acid/polyamine antiporter
MQVGQRLKAQSLNVETGEWLLLVWYCVDIRYFGGFVGSPTSSVAWEGVTLLQAKLKPKHNVGLSLFLGTLLVSVIYIVANVMYLAVVPLFEISLPNQIV